MVNPPIWENILWQTLWWISSTAFPALIWLLLRQPEVAKLFERTASGGFEVVPFAQSVTTTDDASGPPNG